MRTVSAPGESLLPAGRPGHADLVHASQPAHEHTRCTHRCAAPVGAKPQQAESAWASLILPCLDHKQVGSYDPTVATPDSGQYQPVVRAREVIELRPPPRPGVGLEQ